MADVKRIEDDPAEGHRCAYVKEPDPPDFDWRIHNQHAVNLWHGKRKDRG